MEEAIRKVLPLGQDYQLAHFQTHPRETHPLVTQSSKNNGLKTIKIEHFITVIHKEIVFYGLEIFIYITFDEINDSTEKLLFVSKADTNGFNSSKVNIGLLTETIVEYLLKIPIEHYLTNIIPKESSSIKYSKDSITKYTSTKDALDILLKRLQGKLQKPDEIKPYSISRYPQNITVKIALFTRAEPQYLFPESGKNSGKHVLGGEGLLKWWLKSLDHIISSTFEASTTIAKLQIPAEDPKVIQRYLNNLGFNNWSVGDIFNGKDDDIAVFKIPVFPDDPKARFLEHLVVDNRALKIPLKQFWIELQGRQEFRLGVTVSVIGIEGKLKDWNKDAYDGIVVSRKHFKKLKNYITGEDYSSEDGALEAIKNVTDYIETHFGIELKQIAGRYVKPVPKVNDLVPKRPVANNLNTMLVRKKPKK